MTPGGAITKYKFTYNEGLMIGASLELYLATGTASYLSNAHRIAGYLISNEVTSTAYGPVLYDGSNSGCGGDCPNSRSAKLVLSPSGCVNSAAVEVVSPSSPG